MRTRTRTPVPAAVRNLASQPQVNYLEGLRDGKDLSSLTPQQIAWLRDADFSQLTGGRDGQASRVIEQLKALPWIPKDKTGMFPQVADGRYAIYDDGVLKFYSVKQGHSTVFVDVWASDSRWPIKDPNTKLGILLAIKDDPDAGPRFGREIGRCYVCGRTLTDETSRDLGIGPVCRSGGGGHD